MDTAASSSSKLRLVLAADAALEAIGGTALLAPGPVRSALRLSDGTADLLGAAFLAAAAWIVFLLRRTPADARAVRLLAVANVAGGAAAWVLLLAAWTRLDPLGRTVVGAAGDAFLALGAVELLLGRRAR